MMKQTNVVWGRYLPYFASLLVIPISYLSILLLIGQQSLAVFGAALGLVVVYIICKTIQRRGKISLALMIFVLPLLMASGCILFFATGSFCQSSSTDRFATKCWNQSSCETARSIGGVAAKQIRNHAARLACQADGK
jgi:hypothetical protein